MALINKARLTAITESRLGVRLFSERLNEAKAESRTAATISVFLSHSHHDADIVKKAVVFFRDLGIRVYVDWMDPSMPPTTDSATAVRIKERIKESKKFVLLATNRGVESKWCNWELGFGDAHKYIDRIALLPLRENDNTWTGNEYLRIYPRIEEVYANSGTYKVVYPSGRELTLVEWLRL